MPEEVLNREQAIKELDGWFSKKKIKESQKNSQQDAINILIDALMAGELIIDSTTNSITQKLLFPEDITETGSIKELNYKPRLNDVMLKPHLDGNKPGSGTDITLSYMAALTNVNKSILSKLDSSDKRVAMSIVVFFL